MTDDIQGECKTCGENAGGMPAAKSMAELARESWLQDVTVRPYQPTVEALAAARTGARSASEGLGLTAKAMSALSMEEHRPLEAPREFPVEPLNPTPRTQPRVEVSYLSAPWEQAASQEPRTSPTSADAHQWPRANQPQDPLGAIKADPRANADVEYLSWFPGDGSPWVELQAAAARGKRIAFTGGDLPSKGLFTEPEKVSYVLQEENDACVWTVIVRKHKDGSSPGHLEASRVASQVMDAAQAGTLVLPTVFVVKRDDGTEQYFEYDGALGACTLYVSFLGDKDREILGYPTPRPRVVIEIDQPRVEAPPEESDSAGQSPPPQVPQALPDPGRPRTSGNDPGKLALGKNLRWHEPTVSGHNPPDADKAGEYGGLPSAPECGPVYSVKRTLTLTVELDRRELLRKNVRQPKKPAAEQADRLFADEVSTLRDQLADAARKIKPYTLPTFFSEGVIAAISQMKNPKLCPADCPLARVISLDGWTVSDVAELKMGPLEYEAHRHGPSDYPVGWILTGHVSIIGNVTATLWFKYSCSQS